MALSKSRYPFWYLIKHFDDIGNFKTTRNKETGNLKATFLQPTSELRKCLSGCFPSSQIEKLGKFIKTFTVFTPYQPTTFFSKYYIDEIQ